MGNKEEGSEWLLIELPASEVFYDSGNYRQAISTATRVILEEIPRMSTEQMQMASQAMEVMTDPARRITDQGTHQGLGYAMVLTYQLDQLSRKPVGQGEVMTSVQLAYADNKIICGNSPVIATAGTQQGRRTGAGEGRCRRDRTTSASWLAGATVKEYSKTPIQAKGRRTAGDANQLE